MFFSEEKNQKTFIFLPAQTCRIAVFMQAMTAVLAAVLQKH
jgi:hypothetical protein